MNPLLSRMREVHTLVSAAAHAYYNENREILSDREYDALYDELTRLEKETGVVLARSPTQRVGFGVVSALKKVPHAHPMLSLDKTKDTAALAQFLRAAEAALPPEAPMPPEATRPPSGLLTWKLDGLAVSLSYDNGALVQALTRGNGTIGEDITHNARTFTNLPLAVPEKSPFTLRGEAVITYTDFALINEALPPEERYKNPRNLCSGTVRQLNSAIAAQRRVRFYAVGVAAGGTHKRKSEQLKWLAALGFETVPLALCSADTVAEQTEAFKQKILAADIATDGLVLTLDDIAYGASLGATSKFPRDSLAFKWADEQQETTLSHIEWNTSRTGLINPVAVFAPVALEGTTVSRATVHNISILRSLALAPGDRITVYKANMIIPQIAENLTPKGDNAPPVSIPERCPVCDGPTEVVPGPSEEALYCTTPHCTAQRLRALAHFVSRNGMNIDGLSEQTLDKLITLGIVENYPDLFNLHYHEAAITAIEGFGKKSYDNLIAAVEAAKDIDLPHFINALGIRHVGLANAKLLCERFPDIHELIDACTCTCRAVTYRQLLGEIKGFGEAITNALHAYFTDSGNRVRLQAVLPHLRLKTPANAGSAAPRPLDGLTFVITGDVTRYKNRKELQAYIEARGGHVASAVSAKTSYLINNNIASLSGKNKKAAALGVPVLSEEAFDELGTVPK